MSIGTVLYVYLGEVVNEKIISIAVGLNWFAYIVVVFVFPLEIKYIGDEGTLLIFAGICAESCIYTCFDMVETKGLNKRQTKQLFY